MSFSSQRRFLASHAAGNAALTVCESLLISLTERGVISEEEVRGLLSDASESHRQWSRDVTDAEAKAKHSAVASLIERMRDRRDSLRARRSDVTEVDDDGEASGNEA